METRIATQACVVGGGPAGMMLGLLLARSGVRVVVLEKHADFFRDFRGDTVHPSTLELMHELGMLDAFLSVPHQKVEALGAQIGPETVELADFRHLPGAAKYIVFMPQWDFLNFLEEQARRFPTFELRKKTEVVDLVREGDRIVGVSARTPDGPLEVRADLVVACDGRHSITRDKAGLTARDFGAPMDVLWFRLSRLPEDGGEAFGHVESGRMMVMIDRGDYWQCAYLIAKGGIDALKAKGLPAFRETVREMSPFLGDRVEELKDWDDVKLLSVQVNCLERWHRPGFLAIGDAAHAMSPVGGVGINIAVQDAVAAANRLAVPLREGRASEDDLRAIQARREGAARLTQRAQLFIQNRVIANVLADRGTPKVPLVMRALGALPALRRLPARLIGIGVRPEHVRSPAA